MVDELEVDTEAEAIRQCIEDSREALSQKIEQLEEKVVETVETATASVAEATAAVVETVQNATSSVSETVGSVTNAVQGTVDSVRHSVEGTVDTMKETFDISRHVKNHPWLMFGGAIAVGFVGAKLIEGSSSQSHEYQRRVEKDGGLNHPSVVSEPLFASSTGTDSTNGLHSNGAATLEHVTSKQSGWLSELGRALGPELTQLQRLAVGSVISAVRDLVREMAPAPLQEPLSKVIDDLTEKAGGTPLKGSLFGRSTSSGFQRNY